MTIDSRAAPTRAGGPDARIPQATRLVAVIIVPVLVAATVILYLLPEQTGRLFAWAIMPPMTALVMGAGYFSGAYFFTRVATTRQWHRVARGFLPITAFTWVIALATVLHWDRFNHRHISFLAWVVLYAISPVLIPALWLRNRAADPPGLERDDLAVAPAFRWALGGVGVGGLLVALFLFVFPERAIPIWPWRITPLTARTLASWFTLTGAVGLSLAGERRWSAWRILIEAAILWSGLLLIGVIRAVNDFDRSNPLTWITQIGPAGVTAGLVTIYLVMERRRGADRRARTAP